MRTGRQEPTYSVVGDYAYSYGSEVVEMFEDEGGATFYPSQKRELACEKSQRLTSGIDHSDIKAATERKIILGKVLCRVYERI